MFCCYVVQAVDMLITVFVRTTRCDFNCIDGECIAHMYHYTPCGSYTISNDVRSQLKQMYNVTKCFFQLLGNVSMIYGKLRVLTMLEPYNYLNKIALLALQKPDHFSAKSSVIGTLLKVYQIIALFIEQMN